jgi:hypothetical protein
MDNLVNVGSATTKNVMTHTSPGANPETPVSTLIVNGLSPKQLSRDDHYLCLCKWDPINATLSFAI